MLPAEPLAKLVRYRLRDAAVAIVHAGIAADMHDAGEKIEGLSTEGATLGLHDADRWACALGYIPFEVWPIDEWMAASHEEGELASARMVRGRATAQRGEVFACEIAKAPA